MSELLSQRLMSIDGSDRAVPSLNIDRIGFGPDLQIRIYSEISELRGAWLQLESQAAISLFQSYAWLKTWCVHAAPPAGEQPLFAVGTVTSGSIAFILPLGLQRAYGSTMLGWLGQSHASYNQGLYDAVFLRTSNSAQLVGILKAIARSQGAALINLQGQPEFIAGFKNPLVLKHAVPRADDSYEMGLTNNFDSLVAKNFSKSKRNTLRRKANKLHKIGEVKFETVCGGPTAQALLASFFEQKQVQLSRAGAHNTFVSSTVQKFYDELASGGSPELPKLEACSVAVDDDPVAIIIGMTFNGTYYLLNSSMAEGVHTQCSPGALLLHHKVKQACDEGQTCFDLGPGAFAYKAEWSPDRLRCYDMLRPVTPLGTIAAAAEGFRLVIRYYGKRISLLHTTVRFLRRLFRRQWV